LVRKTTPPAPSLVLNVGVHVYDCSRGYASSNVHAAIALDTTADELDPTAPLSPYPNTFVYLSIDPPTTSPGGAWGGYGGILVAGAATLYLENSTVNPAGGPGVAVIGAAA